jgi:hypothetical protein
MAQLEGLGHGRGWDRLVAGAFAERIRLCPTEGWAAESSASLDRLDELRIHRHPFN